MKKHERYIERDDLKDANCIKVSVYYSKGGHSYFSGRSEPRGFYISVTPVTRANGMESFIMFSGYKELICEVNRYSDKQFDRAVDMSTAIEPKLIAAIIEKNRAA